MKGVWRRHFGLYAGSRVVVGWEEGRVGGVVFQVADWVWWGRDFLVTGAPVDALLGLRRVYLLLNLLTVPQLRSLISSPRSSQTLQLFTALGYTSMQSFQLIQSVEFSKTRGSSAQGAFSLGTSKIHLTTLVGNRESTIVSRDFKILVSVIWSTVNRWLFLTPDSKAQTQ